MTIEPDSLPGPARSPISTVPCIESPLGHDGGPTPTAYASALCLPLSQHWCNGMPQEQGHAYIAACAEGLRLYSWFEEATPYTTATHNNQRLFELGSVVEFFICPSGTSTYWEIHLSPNGLIMDIRIPDRDALMRGALDWSEVIAPASHARYTGNTTATAWTTEIIVPWACFERTGIPTGENWGVAVCRYNYPDRLEDPELSATAPFTELSFHRIEEFNRITFP